MQLGWQHQCKIVVCQTEHGQTLASAVQNAKEGEKTTPVRTHVIDPCGHDLGYHAICDKALFWFDKFAFFNNPISTFVVHDTDACNMCVQFADEHKVLIEPLSACAFAALFKHASQFSSFQKIVVIACGGNRCNCDLLCKWKQNK
ncbi:hypothetical protein RFI_01285 [Reticulomyxa filosa]|uniref:L-serine ammonia-lyase n=1 Tax=Reticulomyxa filosa TaxID=46433 RepID=X6PCE9_RETFI|nr:hypothetical protein RFI_01285 [Reticulomyxa filosa]|eukprot:ETO35778.1 hypothetical protein RFI_01285 [Reticulomyxa filosa]